MNTITISNNEALDHALVQCLRFFRTTWPQDSKPKLSSDEKLSAAVPIKKESEFPDGKETSQK